MKNLVVHPQLVIPRNSDDKPFQDCGAYEGTVNCAPAGAAGMANWYLATPGQITHHAFRVAAGDPKVSGKPRGLASSEVLAGLKSFGVDAELHRGQSPDIAAAALSEGAAVGLLVDYATITKLDPSLSGQPTFRKGHFLDVYSWRYADPEFGGVDTVVDHDSLFDGRKRPTYKAPEGPQVGAWSVFAKAMANFRVGSTTGHYEDGQPLGAGRAIFIIVWPT